MSTRRIIKNTSQSPLKGLFVCSYPPAYTTNYLTKLNKQYLSLPPDCQAEVRVRQYTGTGDEYYDAVPWMVVDMSGPQQLSMPVDKVAVGAGGNTLLEMRFVLNTGADFPSGTTAHINTYYIYISHYTRQSGLFPACRCITVSFVPYLYLRMIIFSESLDYKTVQ